MIKKFLCLASTLCFAATLNAAVTVIQEGQQPVTYKSGTALTVTGNAKTVINYDEVVVTVPQGQTVQISSDAKGNVLIAGTNLNRIQVGGSVVSADGRALLLVEPKTQYMSVERGGPAYVTTGGRTFTVPQGYQTKVAAIARVNVDRDENWNIAPYKAQNSNTVQTKQTPVTQEPAEEQVPAFIAEAEAALDNARSTDALAAQQAINDFYLEEEVSPSAPTTGDGGN